MKIFDALISGSIQLPNYPSAPTGATSGSLYFNTGDKQVYQYDGTSWVQIGASVGGVITTGSISTTQAISGSLIVSNSLRVIGSHGVTGSMGISGSQTIYGSGSNLFTIDGSVGRLFVVDDSLSGSLYSVNTIAGLPIIEAFSDNTVRIGQYGQRALFVSQSRVGFGKETSLNGIIDISGNTTTTGSLLVSGSANITGGLVVGFGGARDLQVTSTGVLLGSAVTDINNVTGALVVSNSLAVTGTFAVTTAGATASFNVGITYVSGGLGVGTATPNTVGLIRATNDVIAFFSSDERLKENKTKISGSLDKLKLINGYEFDWIPVNGIHENKGHDIGVIAQEVEKVLPEIVTTRDNGFKAVKYEKLVALLIESNKELLKRIENLESKIN